MKKASRFCKKGAISESVNAAARSVGRESLPQGLTLGYIGLALGVMGIPLLVGMIQSDRERLHRLATERKEIASSDGRIKVTVSGMWAKLPELNKQATVQVGYKDKEMYLIVITDAKTAVGNMTLEQDHQLTRDRMLHKMKIATRNYRNVSY